MPRKTAAQKKVEAITASLQIEGYLVIAGEDGKYAVRKKGGRKLLAEKLTVAALEVHAANLIKPIESTDKAIATEPKATTILHESDDPTDQILGEGSTPASVRSSGKGSAATEDLADDDEVIEDVTWDIGKGKATIFKDKKANGAHALYEGQELFLVEARYVEDTWAVYIGRACVASQVQGLDNAKAAAVQKADQLIAAQKSGDFVAARHILEPRVDPAQDKPAQETAKEKGKGKPKAEAIAPPVAAATPEPEPVSPANNPNTNPQTAKMLHSVFGVPRIADLVGNVATPEEQIAKAIANLDPLQVKGKLTLRDLCDAIQRPTDTSRMEIALYLATNGVEIKFLGGDRVELTTTAPPPLVAPVSAEAPEVSQDAPQESDDSLDISRFL